MAPDQEGRLSTPAFSLLLSERFAGVAGLPLTCLEGAGAREFGPWALLQRRCGLVEGFFQCDWHLRIVGVPDSAGRGVYDVGPTAQHLESQRFWPFSRNARIGRKSKGPPSL